MAKLCLTLAAPTVAELESKIRRYTGQVPLIEVRLDFLEHFGFPSIPEESETRYLATCRPVREGGFYQGTEEDRLRILAQAPAHRFSLVDLEADVLHSPGFPGDVQVLRSSHDFQACPFDLEENWEKLLSQPGELGKMVVTPQDTSDLVRLLCFMERSLPGAGGIILGMGPLSRITRIIGPFLGNSWTYVSEGSGGVAPGQFSLRQALDTYRLPERERTPDLFGVTGRDNVDLVDWVEYMNRLVRDAGLDALVFPLPDVKMELFLSYVQESKLPYSGFVQLGGEVEAATGAKDIRVVRRRNQSWEEIRVPVDAPEASGNKMLSFWRGRP